MQCYTIYMGYRFSSEDTKISYLGNISQIFLVIWIGRKSVFVMTPAITAAKQHKIGFRIHPYRHNPQSESYGLEAADALEINANLIFKTLLVSSQAQEQWLAMCILPVNRKLDLKLAAMALNLKRVVMADPDIAERVTGYVVGGISPLGQKRRLSTLLDDSAITHRTIYVSGGRRGLELELKPDDLVRLGQARLVSISR